jgi:chemotaxis protein histidine kinase CheA
MNAYELASSLRDVVADIRRKPYPISDLIPQLTSAADVLYEQAEKLNKYKLRNQEQIKRIAELEKELQNSALNNLSTMAQADEHYARVQELEKENAFLKDWRDTWAPYVNQSNTQLHPLTENQIATLFNYHPADLNFPRLVADVRVVERAHGIGETK